uniref:FTH domain-containing protein n=1 Tax=Steinernema glaseri TaxID=37863 RepID=A0A1I7ZBH6_9BILA
MSNFYWYAFGDTNQLSLQTFKKVVKQLKIYRNFYRIGVDLRWKWCSSVLKDFTGYLNCVRLDIKGVSVEDEDVPECVDFLRALGKTGKLREIISRDNQSLSLIEPLTEIEGDKTLGLEQVHQWVRTINNSQQCSPLEVTRLLQEKHSNGRDWFTIDRRLFEFSYEYFLITFGSEPLEKTHGMDDGWYVYGEGNDPAFVHQNQRDVCTLLHRYFDIRNFSRDRELSQLTEKSPILQEVQTLLDEYIGIPKNEFSSGEVPWPLDEERDRFLLEDGCALLTDAPCVDPTQH